MTRRTDRDADVVLAAVQALGQRLDRLSEALVERDRADEATRSSLSKAWREIEALKRRRGDLHVLPQLPVPEAPRPAPERRLGVTAAARLLGRSRKTIQRWIARGLLPPPPPGERWSAALSDLEPLRQGGVPNGCPPNVPSTSAPHRGDGG